VKACVGRAALLESYFQESSPGLLAHPRRVLTALLHFSNTNDWDVHWKIVLQSDTAAIW
jgi:hypothetical protein